MWVLFGFVYMELALNYLLFLNMIGVCCVNGVERFCEIIFHTLYVLLLRSIAHYGGVEGDKGAKCNPLVFKGLFNKTCEQLKCN